MFQALLADISMLAVLTAAIVGIVATFAAVWKLVETLRLLLPTILLALGMGGFWASRHFYELHSHAKALSAGQETWIVYVWLLGFIFMVLSLSLPFWTRKDIKDH